MLRHAIGILECVLIRFIGRRRESSVLPLAHRAGDQSLGQVALAGAAGPDGLLVDVVAGGQIMGQRPVGTREPLELEAL